jgi:hypothetical protein
MADQGTAAAPQGAQDPQAGSGAGSQAGQPAQPAGQPAGQQGQQSQGSTVLTGADPKGAPAQGNEPGNKGGEGDKGEGKKPDAVGAPETYADFKMPEGMPEGMAVDTALLDSFRPVAKELNLTQEQAQKLVDLYSSRMLEQSKSLVDNHIAQVDQWQSSLPKDSEIGGVNGQQFEANVKIAQSAFVKFGTPELGKLLEDTGIGNHPELVRFGLRIGKAISEDSLSGLGSGARGAPAPKSAADRLYGNQQS